MRAGVEQTMGEEKRLKDLYSYNILYSKPEAEFDAITQLAAYICDCPTALISFIDKDKQWFKSSFGLNMSESSRSTSFCQYTILGNDAFEIMDATKYERFVDNPFVTGDTHLRHYTGVPITTSNGHNIGTMCVIDTKPKELSKGQIDQLKLLAKQVMVLLEARKLKNEIALSSYESENFFQLSSSLLLVLDGRGRFLRVNECFTETTGYIIDYLNDRCFTDLIHSADQPQIIALLHRLKTDLPETKTIVSFQTTNGNFMLVEWRLNYHKSEDCFFAIGEDVTETLIKESKSNAEQEAIDTSLIKLVMEPNGRIISASKSLEKSWGFRKDELVSKYHKDLLFDADLLNADYEVFWQELLNGQKVQGDFLRKDRFNRERWIYGTYVPIKSYNGKVMRIVLIGTDATKKIITERKLIEKNEELDQFAFIVSHDLKAPLRGINTLIEFIEEDHQEELNDEVLNYFKLMKDRVKRLQYLVNDILEYSKIGRTKTTKREFTLNDLIEEVIGLIDFPEHFQLSNQSPNYTLFGEKIYVYQVVKNLISNAVKYNDKKEGRLEIFTTLSDKYLEIHFKDNGIGIPQELQSKIFDVFQTLETSNSPDSTGVGLSTVKKIAREINGEIDVSSDGKTGSEFTFYLPKSYLK